MGMIEGILGVAAIITIVWLVFIWKTVPEKAPTDFYPDIRNSVYINYGIGRWNRYVTNGVILDPERFSIYRVVRYFRVTHVNRGLNQIRNKDFKEALRILETKGFDALAIHLKGQIKHTRRRSLQAHRKIVLEQNAHRGSK